MAQARNDERMISASIFKQPWSRHYERSEAIHCRTTKKMDCFVAYAPRNDVNNLRRTVAFSLRDPREFFHRRAPPKQRAQGMPDAQSTRSRACRIDSTRVSHHRSTGITRHSLRDGFNGFLRALPGDRALLPPSSLRSLLLKNLNASVGASGPHDFAVRKSIVRPRNELRSTPSRPSHSAPNVRDDREAPLLWVRNAATSR